MGKPHAHAKSATQRTVHKPAVHRTPLKHQAPKKIASHSKNPSQPAKKVMPPAKRVAPAPSKVVKNTHPPQKKHHVPVPNKPVRFTDSDSEGEWPFRVAYTGPKK
jgi:hypothetical protein